MPTLSHFLFSSDIPFSFLKNSQRCGQKMYLKAVWYVKCGTNTGGHSPWPLSKIQIGGWDSDSIPTETNTVLVMQCALRASFRMKLLFLVINWSKHCIWECFWKDWHHWLLLRSRTEWVVMGVKGNVFLYAFCSLGFRTVGLHYSESRYNFKIL